MPKLRNLIIISASIFLFLALLGIIGGNSFSTILARSILGALFLSLLIIGAFFIINRIISEIPGLNNGQQQNEENSNNGVVSNNLDIVLDRENPYETDSLASDSENSDLSNSRQFTGNSSAEDLVEEVEEDSLGDINSLDIKQNDNEVIEVMNDNLNSGDSGNSSLPAIDLQTDLFGDADVTPSAKRENEALNSLGDNANAKTMAKAIKTVLTRDSKG